MLQDESLKPHRISPESVQPLDAYTAAALELMFKIRWADFFATDTGTGSSATLDGDLGLDTKGGGAEVILSKADQVVRWEEDDDLNVLKTVKLLDSAIHEKIYGRGLIDIYSESNDDTSVSIYDDSQYGANNENNISDVVKIKSIVGNNLTVTASRFQLYGQQTDYWTTIQGKNICIEETYSRKNNQNDYYAVNSFNLSIQSNSQLHLVLNSQRCDSDNPVEVGHVKLNQGAQLNISWKELGGAQNDLVFIDVTDSGCKVNGIAVEQGHSYYAACTWINGNYYFVLCEFPGHYCYHILTSGDQSMQGSLYANGHFQHYIGQPAAAMSTADSLVSAMANFSPNDNSMATGVNALAVPSTGQWQPQSLLALQKAA